MARKFLYVVAGLIVIAIAASFAYRLFGTQLMRAAMVPPGAYVAPGPQPAGAYADPVMWFARPGAPDDPARWLPPGVARAAPAGAAVFFVHPTSYLDRRAWNAPLDDAPANDRARTLIRGQASAFNGVGDVWAPRYRQATFGAFLTTRRDAQQALAAAYGDVLAAWDRFLVEAGPARPIILAGHSQGALHLIHLLKDRVAGRAITRRIVAVYAVGWPISLAHDLPALGLPACTAPDQTGCILSWQSFAEPADTAQVSDMFDASTGFDGRPRRGSRMLCVNPLTGTQDGIAPASANRGTLLDGGEATQAVLQPGGVPARCDARGFLLIGDPPLGIGAYVLPGNNYHIFDYALFWANIRADAARRLAAFGRH